MSTFENDQYQWRETYFVLFASAKRPSLDALVKRLTKLDPRLSIASPSADSAGRFESVTVLAPEACSAIDICYTAGEEVVEQCRDLARDLKQAECCQGECSQAECSQGEPARAVKVGALDARFDVLHFEQVADEDDEDPDDAFDPSALLIILEALAELTGGVAVDPQTGSLMS